MNKDLPKDKQLVKIGEAAKILGVSIDTLRRWEQKDKIETVRTPGGTRLYSVPSLNQFLGQKGPKSGHQKLRIQSKTQIPAAEAGLSEPKIRVSTTRIYNSKPADPATLTSAFLHNKQNKHEFPDLEEILAQPTEKVENPFHAPALEEGEPLEWYQQNPQASRTQIKNAETEFDTYTLGYPVMDYEDGSQIYAENGIYAKIYAIYSQLGLNSFYIRIAATSFVSILLFSLLAISLIISAYYYNPLKTRQFFEPSKKADYLHQASAFFFRPFNTVAQLGLLTFVPEEAKKIGLVAPLTISPENQTSVLAASSIATDNQYLEINADTNITNNLRVEGESVFIGNITAPNIIYGLVAGANITISPGQTPTISANNTETLASVTARGATTNTLLTLNGGITLGNVLNLGNLTSDPAVAINGQTYYNSTTNLFRCYQNGSWKNCDTTGGSGTVTSVGTGNGLTGGAITDSGTISVNLKTSGTSANTSSNSGMEVSGSGLSLISGCTDTQTLTWNSTLEVWECTTQGTGFTGLILAGASGPPQPITDGDTITVAPADGVTTITSATDTVTIGLNLAASATASTATITSGSGLETAASGLTLIRGCATGQLLKWDNTAKEWGCSNDSGATSAIINVEEGGVPVGTNIDTLNFSGSDFALTESPSGTDNIAIDYPNSHITRDNQNQTISGNWLFNGTLTASSTVSFTGLLPSSGSALCLDGSNIVGTCTGAGTGTITAVGNVTGGSAFTGNDSSANKGNNLIFEGSTTVNDATDITVTAVNPAVSRTYTLPDLGTNGTFAFLEGTQTFSGAKTFSALITGNGGLALNRTLTPDSGANVNVGSIIFTTPADTAGTNVNQGLNISPTIGNATGGSNTANIINIAAVTGDAQVSLNAVNIGALTGTGATETAINIGPGWDSVLNVNGTTVINATGQVPTTRLTGTLFLTNSSAISQGNTLTFDATSPVTVADSGSGTITYACPTCLTSASGVSSVTGTTNQITASPTTGAVVLSLPAAITTPGSLTTTTSLTATTDLTVNGNTTLNGSTATIGDATTDRLTVTSQLLGGSPLILQGATDNANNLTLAVTEPTAARTQTFQDNSGIIPLGTAGNTLFFTTTGPTNVTLPTSGTVCTTATCLTSGTGVTSVTGTANQITSSPTTGAVVLSLPAAITTPGSLTTTTSLTATTDLTVNGNTTIGNATTDRLTVTSQLLGGSPLVLQGATDDTFTTTLALTDPATSSKTITFPNASGTVAVSATSPIALSATGDISCSTCLTSATGVSSVTGTANQITSSPTTGAVILSLPAAITTPGSLTTTTDLSVNGNTTIGDATTDRLTVTSQILGASPLVFQGATDNSFNTTLAFTDPATSSKTITFPNASGTVAVSATGPITLSALGDIGCSTCLTSASGVTSVTGTANQITSSPTTGAVILSLPAAITTPGSLTTTTSLTATTDLTVNGNTSLNGNTATIGNATTDRLTVTSQLLGGSPLVLQGATDDANSLTLALTEPTAARTQTFQDNSGIIPLGTAGNTLFFTTTGPTTITLPTSGTVCSTATCLTSTTGVTTATGTANQILINGDAAAHSGAITLTLPSAITTPGSLTTTTDLSVNGNTTLGDALTDGVTVTGEIRGASPLTFEGATNDNIYTIFAFTDPTGSSKTITFPNASGTVAVSATTPVVLSATGDISCPTCVTTAAAGVTSLDSLTGALTIANSSGVGSVITIDNATTAAKGIASFNSTNFTVTGGAVNTIQDIATTSSPTFAALTLTSAAALNLSNTAPVIAIGNTGTLAITDGTNNLLTLADNGTTGTLTVNALTVNSIDTIAVSATALTFAGAGTISSTTSSPITLDSGTTGNVNVGTGANAKVVTVGNLTGATSLALRAGTGGLSIINADTTLGSTFATNTLTDDRIAILPHVGGAGRFTATISSVDLTVGNQTFNLPDLGAATSDTFCIRTLANCFGSGSGITGTAPTTNNTLAMFAGSGASVTDSLISQSGSTITITPPTATDDILSLQPHSGGPNRFTATLGTEDLTVGNQIFNLPDLGGATTVTICVSSGNCTGSGGVTFTNQVTNALTKFTAVSGEITSSNITDDGTIINIGSTTGAAALNLRSGTAGTTLTTTSATGTIFNTATATDDQLALRPNVGGPNRFTATISSDDLTGGNQTFLLPDLGSAITTTICTTASACASAGSVTDTPAGAANQIAYFTAADNITSSATLTFNPLTLTGNTVGLTNTALTTGKALSVVGTSTNTANTAGGITQNLFDVTNAQSTTALTNGFNGLGVNFTNNPSVAGNTENAVRIQNQVTANTTDNAVSSLLLLDNADTTAGGGSTVVTDALRITNSGAIAAGITNGINLASTTINTGINFSSTPTTNYILGTNFTVTSAGAETLASSLTAVGVNSGSGLLQGTGGITTTGTANINASGAAATNLGTGTGNVSIGNLTGTFALASSGGLNVSTGGALTGVSGITTSGGYTQSGSGVNTFSGDLASNANTTIGDATTDRLTVTSQILGGSPLVFQGATDNAFTTTFAFTDPATSSKTITFPNATGTVAVSATGPITLSALGDIGCSTCLTSATGVSSVTGTTNQITASPTTGAVVLSLPAAITAPGSLTTTTSLTATTDLTVNGNTTIGNATTDRLTVTSQLLGGSPLVLQGATDNANNLTLAVTEPTAANTQTFQDNSGIIPLGTAGNTLFFTTTGSTNVTLPTSGTICSTATCLTSTTGVTTATGTANQILINGDAAAHSGAITLTLPSAITTPGSLTTTSTLTAGTDLAVNGNTTLNGNTATVGDATTDRLTVTSQILGASPLVFQGATDNSFTTTLAFTDPATSSKTITFPNATGTVAVSATGPITLSALGDIGCSTCLTSASGVTSVTGTTNQITSSPTTGAVILSLPAAITAPGSLTTTTSLTATTDLAVNGNTTLNGNTATIGNATTDRLTVTSQLLGASPLVLQGATDDANNLTLALTDPTAARTQTFQDNSGIIPLGTAGNTLFFTTTGPTNLTLPTSGTVCTTATCLTSGTGVTSVTGTTNQITSSPTTGAVILSLPAAITAPGSLTTTTSLTATTDLTVNGNTTIGDATTDRLTVTSQLLGGSPLVFQGATDNSFTTTLAFTDPTTPSKTITFPNATGTVAVSATSPITLSAAGAIGCSTCLTSSTGVTSVTGTASQITASPTTGAVVLSFPNLVTFPNAVEVGTTLQVFGATILGTSATDSITLNGALLGVNPILFEGATHNSVYTTLSVADPSIARTITLPNASGTVAVSATAPITLSAAGDIGCSTCLTSATGVSSVTGTTNQITASPTTGAVVLSLPAAITAPGSLTTTTSLTATTDLTVNGNTTIGNATTDRLTVTSQLLGGSPLVFQGATDNSFTTTLAFIDPTTPSKTITFPNATGTVAVSATSPVTLSAAGDIGCATCLTAASGVTSVTGTTNQITASPTTGAVVLSLPSAITTPGSLTTTTGLTAGNALTLTTGALNLTATSGALTLSGLSASSINTGANDLTITSSNFNTTATGINSTAIGASTPSSGAFTTLTSSGSSTLGTGASSVNSIGSATTPGALTLHGATTLDNTFTVSGANATTLGGTLGVTGVTTLSGDLAANGNTTIGNATTDRLTVTSQILGASPLVFQGATDNAFTTTLAFTDPTTPSKVITFPNATGTVCVSGQACALSGTVSGTGTQNFLTKWDVTGAAIQDSAISDAANVVTFAGTTTLTATSLATLTSSTALSLNPNTGTTYTLNTTATTLNLFNTTSTAVNFAGAATTLAIGPGGATATTIDIAGGSGNTGCTVLGASGNLACTGTITSNGNTVTTGTGTSGQVAFFNATGVTSEASGFGWSTAAKQLAITGAAGTTLAIASGVAPTASIATISNAGFATTTTGVNDLSLTLATTTDAGSDTNSGLNIALTAAGDGSGVDTVNGINITSAGTASSDIFGVNVGSAGIAGSGGIFGLNIGALSGTGIATAIQTGAITASGGAATQIQTGNVTAVAGATNAQLILGTTKATTGTAAGSTNLGIKINPLDSTGTINTGIDIGALSGATTSKGVNIGALSSATSVGVDIGNFTGATSNIGVRVGTLATATTSTGVAVGALSSATSKGLTIGALSGTTSNVGVTVGALSGTGATSTGLSIGNISSTGSDNQAINTGTLTGGTASNIMINTGVITGIGGANNAQINLGAVSTAGANNYGVNIGAISGATNNFAINTAQGQVNFVDNSNTAASLVLTNNTATTIGAGVNTLGVFDIQSTSLTTGNLVNLEGNGLTTGTMLNVASTSTALTGTAVTGHGLLGNYEWNPGSAVTATATGDLLRIAVGANGVNNPLNLLDLVSNSSSIFSVSQTAVTTSLPISETAPGDLSIAYDLNFTNPTASFIKSAAPINIISGETFNSSDLTLTTYNTGNIVLDTANQVQVGNSSSASNLQVDLAAGTGANTVNVATGTGSSTINIGTGSQGTKVVFFSRTAPPATLATNGQVAFGTTTAGATGGRIWMRASNINYRFNASTATLDYSEYLRQDESSEPGDVMVLSDSKTQSVKKTDTAYHQDVLGVVTQYGTGNTDDPCSDDPSCGRGNDPRWANIGMLGQVYTKISTENGDIKPGDPLTTSTVKGVAMKATKAGRTLGYAIDFFDGTTSGQDQFNLPTYPVHDTSSGGGQTVKVGKILILLQAGWFDPAAAPVEINTLEVAQQEPATPGAPPSYSLNNTATQAEYKAQLTGSEALIGNLTGGTAQLQTVWTADLKATGVADFNKILTNTVEAKTANLAMKITPAGSLTVNNGTTDVFKVDSKANVILGQGNITAAAKDGFAYLPSIQGAPSGTPTDIEGHTAIAFDKVNDQLCAYNKSWKCLSFDNKGSLVTQSIKTNSLEISGANAKLIVNGTGIDPTTLLQVGQLASGVTNLKSQVQTLAEAIANLGNAQKTLDSRLSTLDSNTNVLGEQLASQSANLASQSAQIATANQKIDDLSRQLNASESASASATLAELKDELAKIKSAPSASNLTSINPLLATESATLGDLKVNNRISTLKLDTIEATVSSTFKSLGESFLGNTTIAGDLSVDGTFSINNGNSLNSLPALYIQNNPLTELVDFFNGLVTIDKDGTLKAKTVVAEQIKVTPNKSAGQALIKAGQKELAVFNDLIDDNSIVIITPETSVPQTLAATDKVAASGFVVKISSPAPTDVKFSYLIVGQSASP